MSMFMLDSTIGNIKNNIGIDDSNNDALNMEMDDSKNHNNNNHNNNNNSDAIKHHPHNNAGATAGGGGQQQTPDGSIPDDQDLQNWFTAADVQHLEEFDAIAYNNRADWKYELSKSKHGIKVEYLEHTKYKCTLSRSTCIIRNNPCATPAHIFNILCNDYNMIKYLDNGCKRVDVRHVYNKCKRVLEFSVHSDTRGVAPRNYLIHETFAIAPNDPNNPKTSGEKLLVIMRSLANGDLYYSQPSDPAHVRAVMFRTGWSLQSIPDFPQHTKLTMIMEYNIGGSSIIAKYAKFSVHTNAFAYNMSWNFRERLEFLCSSHFVSIAQSNDQLFRLQSAHKQLTQQCLRQKKENEHLLQLQAQQSQQMQQMQQQLRDARQELEQLKRQQQSAVNCNEYKVWNASQILLWISSLENGRYTKYLDILKISLIEQTLRGVDLCQVNEMDLLSFGVNGFNDRKCLYKHICELVSKYSNDNHNVNVNDNANGMNAGQFKNDNENENENENELLMKNQIEGNANHIARPNINANPNPNQYGIAINADHTKYM